MSTTSSTVGKASLQKQPRVFEDELAGAKRAPPPASASTSGHKAAHMAGVKATFGGACTAPPATRQKVVAVAGRYAYRGGTRALSVPVSVSTVTVSLQGAGETT